MLETMDREEKMSSIRAITIVSLLAFGTVAKELYSPILFFVLLIPDSKFGSKKQAWIFRAFVMVMFVWCVAAVLIPGTNEGVWNGDDRFPGADSQGQLHYLMAHPIEGGMTLIRYFWENQSLLMKAGISHWAYVGNNYQLNDLYLWMLLIVAPLCTAGERWDRKSLMTPVRRIFLGVIAFGAELLFIFALYVTSSPVGGTEIAGMQARYFMPVWIALALALMWPHAIRRRMGKIGEWMTAGVWAFCLIANLQNAIMHMSATGLL